uniref:Serine protease n=1 Tax=Riboviria sp. TaxID=2585031 RepID=A0A8K1U461_9VIRU|nr:MAG: hypothetical protein 2 [Riboviria sp.]
MPESRVYADDVFDLMAMPFTVLWVCFPTFIRKKITAVPREALFMVAKAIWTVIFYYWLYTWICPIITVPPFVYHWINTTTVAYDVAVASVGSWYATLKVSMFQLLVPMLSLISWILSWRTRPVVEEKTLTQRVVSRLSDVFYVPESAQIKYPDGFTPERAIQGSPLTPVKELPAFVAFLYGINDDDSENPVGVGFRAENAFITAAHNLTGYERLKIISNTAVCEVRSDSFIIHPYDDLAHLKMSDRDFSMLGLTKGKFLDHAVSSAYPLMCQVYGPGTPASFTVGAVSQVANFGKVTYSGTTTSGFSGSPYVQHKTIVGMHLGAGMVNMGLDAAYIAMLVSSKNESTEDWLLDRIEEDLLNKRSVEWERSPTNPDEVFVKRLGKYFIIDADMFFSSYKPQAIVSESFSVKDKLPVYSDSKNGVTASVPVNAGAGAVGQVSAIRNCVQTPLSASCTATPTSIVNLEESSVMDNQEPMPVVRNGLLDCTSNSISYQPERKTRRQIAREKKFKKSSHTHTNPGSPGLDLIR